MGTLNSTLSIKLENDNKINGVFTFYQENKKYLLFKIKGFVKNKNIYFKFDEFVNSDYTNKFNQLVFVGSYSINKKKQIYINGTWIASEYEIYLKDNDKYHVYKDYEKLNGTFELFKD